MDRISSAKAFLFDLDGTLYLGEKLIGRADETLRALRASGKKIVFLTNNSSKTVAMYREKLSFLGLFQDDLIYTSASSAIDYLLARRKGKKVFLLGTEALKGEFLKSGVPLSEEEPYLLLLAYDKELTFEKIERFDFFLRQGKEYFATHPDLVCPTLKGPIPDVGSFISLFSASCNRLPQKIFGKPYREMAEGVLRKLNLAPEEVCMVGDRIYTDIRFAAENSMKSVLVLSGESRREDLLKTKFSPTLVLSNVDEILNFV